jgi:hypothetical protein
MTIEPSRDPTFVKSVTGRLQGTLSKIDEKETNIPDGTPVDLTIEILRKLEPAVYPSPHRELQCDVKGELLGDEGGEIRASVQGKILNVRSFWNRYAAPLDAEGLEETHGDLGKFFDIGLVYTWIAGLLNLLAMWDAYEGPAYGYGDEEPAAPGTPNPNSGTGADPTQSAAANPTATPPPTTPQPVGVTQVAVKPSSLPGS